ncbi:DUF1801 domain-containing protein [Sphingobacterium griseoflavum]|uniref:YdhG-like domain-containing protein n=1 Tax=Sphingobacterium griseoflavum TaxID=1474952 RepID=A0ABQ3HU45_9SPHI|nr:DUF1801 domain-containing protein [Sphingobacterium griseoflavum]GHE31756.1 hypothetical protein GCM10017764_13620 [Sphingobacterium griseoflavum]
MAKNKTTYTGEEVSNFLQQLSDEQKRQDSLALIALMEEVSGEQAQMFGPSIIGFGKYAYRYASGHAGEAPLVGFSPRKDAISLYVYTGADEHRHLLDGLGKFKMGKACIYVKRLTDIDSTVLTTLMTETIAFLSNTYTRVANN